MHTAAGCLLAHEAGAIVTALDGSPWSLAHRSHVLAATPALHADLLAVAAAAVQGGAEPGVPHQK